MSQDTKKQVLENLGTTTAVAFSFDTTGSMQPCIADVRKKLKDLVEDMTANIPGIKIGLIAHGDYCDGQNCIRTLDLTDDISKLIGFINEAPNTNGGDVPECYELALRKASEFSWPEAGGALVLIGDATPHEPNEVVSNVRTPYNPDNNNPDNINWREELEVLASKNVKVFPLQCLKSQHDNEQNAFWEAVSEKAQTPLLFLGDFKESAATLGSVAYAMVGDDALKTYTARTCVNADYATSASYLRNTEKLSDFAKTREVEKPE